MNKLRNDRYLRALLKQPVEQTPVWMMRQAGRYLPEYRQIRAEVSGFMQLCQTAELACEVTLQPLRRYDLDAAIIFSDILTIPDAMGLGLHFIENEGPCFERPLTHEAQIAQLPLINPQQDLAYVMEAIRLTRHELNNSVPLIGFSGSPWTLATYMVEGKSSKSFTKIKKMLYSRPELLEQLLAKLIANVTAYLNAQIEAGAQALMIFDTWGGLLTHEAYLQFSLNPIQQIIQGLNLQQHGTTVPVTVFTKGGGLWLSDIAQVGCHCVGLDWSTDIGLAKQTIGQRVALQGNLDPSILYANPKVIVEQVAKILAKFGQGSGHIFNLGHGIHPDIPPEHVAVFVDAVHQISQQYHALPQSEAF